MNVYALQKLHEARLQELQRRHDLLNSLQGNNDDPRRGRRTRRRRR